MGVDFSTRPEIAAALGGSTYQETRHSDTLSADILATAVPILHQGRVVGAVRVTQSVAAVNSAVRRSIVGIVLLGLAVLALGVDRRRSDRPADRQARSGGWPTRPTPWRRATWTRARRSRAPPNSERWPAASTT